MYNFSYCLGRNANLDMITKAIEIDKLVYKEKHHTIFENIKTWYNKNNDTITILKNNDDIIGYFCFLPIIDSLYNDIKDGKMETDILITSDQINTYVSKNNYNLYLFSIVIHPAFQGSQALKCLLAGFFENLRLLIHEGITFNNALADAISTKGAKTAQLISLQKIKNTNHGSIIFEAPISDVIKQYSKRFSK